MDNRYLNKIASHLLFCWFVFFSILDSSCDEPKIQQENVKQKQNISPFYRHYDCVVRLCNEENEVINSTLYRRNQHLENILVEFSAFGRHFVLKLELNKELLATSYVQRVFTHQGEGTQYTAENTENCHYHGYLASDKSSLAALSTCKGVRGYFIDKRDTYFIEPIKGNIHRVYREKDMRKLNLHCGTDTNDSRLHYHRDILKRNKRSLRLPYDSNKNTRYVELYLVNDYRTFQRHGNDTKFIIQRSQSIANIVSSLYRQLNIYVLLVGVEVWTVGDRVRVTQSADTTMENFLRYRKERINPYYHNDNAQLITGVFFEHGVVGKAIKGPICTHQFSGGVNMDYGGPEALVATTVAHEMGHNFGMEHDNDSNCNCLQDRCIMAATSGQVSPRHWSSCSQNALAEAFDLGMDYCLQNIPDKVFQGPVCGNGFKEEGEECDCGLPSDCSNRCCNPHTCRLYAKAECATGRCCDLSTCKPKARSNLCREPVGECDFAEFCNGTSEYCPSDVFRQNGVPCKSKQSYCYNGQCRTHTSQCELLWGETGRSSDPICFQQLNMNGDSNGNCGYDWVTEKYKRCDRENVMCGLLHCVHLNEKLMFWRDNLALDMQASFLSRGNKQYVCRSAKLDVGLDMPDPGMVPDGAKCEHNKICINQKCVPLAKLRVKSCPSNCHNNGKCNSEGNCHCDMGYSPPLCDKPGFGGSIDSGPASDDYDNTDLLIGMLVLFLIILPLIVLAGLAFYNRRHLSRWWKMLPTLIQRIQGKSIHKKPPPQPPQPTPQTGGGRKEFHSSTESEGEGLIAKPLIHRNGPDKSKIPPIWNPHNKNPSHVAPPRPVAPKRPAAMQSAKNNTQNNSSNQSRVILSVPVQETCGPPSSGSEGSSSKLVTSVSKKENELCSSPKTGIKKRESFRGSEISQPVLMSTTNRNSLVLAGGQVDIIGPEAGGDSTKSQPVKRSHSERQVTRPTEIPPAPGSSTLKKSSSAKSGLSNTKTVTSPKIKSRPLPPDPIEDSPQPMYSNNSNDIGLLESITGALNMEAPLYTNLSSEIHAPIQETCPPPAYKDLNEPLSSKFTPNKKTNVDKSTNNDLNKPSLTNAKDSNSQISSVLRSKRMFENKQNSSLSVDKPAIKPTTNTALAGNKNDPTREKEPPKKLPTSQQNTNSELQNKIQNLKNTLAPVSVSKTKPTPHASKSLSNVQTNKPQQTPSSSSVSSVVGKTQPKNSLTKEASSIAKPALKPKQKVTFENKDSDLKTNPAKEVDKTPATVSKTLFQNKPSIAARSSSAAPQKSSLAKPATSIEKTFVKNTKIPNKRFEKPEIKAKPIVRTKSVPTTQKPNEEGNNSKEKTDSNSGITARSSSSLPKTVQSYRV